MITVEEFMDAKNYWHSEDYYPLLIEFAKLHVTAALNTIYEKGLSDITTWDGNPEGSEYLDFDKLIAAYPLDLIK
jgi:hypothetical protein